MDEEKYPYQKEWASLRLRNRLFWSFAFCLIPLYFLLDFSVKKLSENLQNIIGFFVFIDWGLIIFTLISFYVWKCPRCKNNYFRFLESINFLFDFECKNCSLKKYEGSDFESVG